MGEISVSLIVISVILATIVLGTIIGNIFVIVAIKIDKNLQTTANQLVLSLAMADLMVACLVMPLGAYNDLGQGWYLGKLACEFWTSADVLCCTGKQRALSSIRAQCNPGAGFLFIVRQVYHVSRVSACSYCSQL